MPRDPRFSYPQALHHVTLRCNNREFLFEEPWFDRFVGLLQAARARFRIKLFSYCVMTNHVHAVALSSPCSCAGTGSWTLPRPGIGRRRASKIASPRGSNGDEKRRVLRFPSLGPHLDHFLGRAGW